MRVVLLHSALGDSRLWRHQIPALSGSFDVVAPDLPGFGSTPMPREEFSFVEFVDRSLPAAVVGNSMGGMIALRTACAFPDRVERLVLVGAGMPGWEFTEEMRVYWAAEAEAIDAGDLEAAAEINLEFWVQPELFDEVRPQMLRALQLQTAHEEPPVRWPEELDLGVLQMPVLVVVGADDKPDFRAIAQHLAESIPGSELAEVEGAGHLAGLDQPAALNELLLEFLSR
ncbi:MAG TPA: alpha/beta fold hydrolase [Gaiellaceae bacterium]|nr:alpha/beta fold hydrolase [Gaiellaceae bacterium]